jgi:hypothetical protein
MTLKVVRKSTSWRRIVVQLRQLLDSSGSQSVLRGRQGTRDQFPGDPWIHFCNGCFEFHLFFN